LAKVILGRPGLADGKAAGRIGLAKLVEVPQLIANSANNSSTILGHCNHRPGFVLEVQGCLPIRATRLSASAGKESSLAGACRGWIATKTAEMRCRCAEIAPLLAPRVPPPTDPPSRGLCPLTFDNWRRVRTPLSWFRSKPLGSAAKSGAPLFSGLFLYWPNAARGDYALSPRGCCNWSKLSTMQRWHSSSSDGRSFWMMQLMVG
jgi:hypothetical protein